MRSFKVLSSTLALAALLLAGGAAAQPQGGPPQGGPPGPRPEGGPDGGCAEALATYLTLTDAQKTAAQALQESLHATVQPLAEKERTAHEAIRAALDAASRDAAALGALTLQAYDAHKQIKAARDAFDTAFAALLTAEQKAKLECFKSVQDALRPGPPGPAN